MPTVIKTKTIESFEVLGFICDRCKTYYPENTEDDKIYLEKEEVLRWHHVGGYGSLIGDGNFIDICLCQACWFELFKPFAEIKVYGFNPETGKNLYENIKRIE